MPGLDVNQQFEPDNHTTDSGNVKKKKKLVAGTTTSATSSENDKHEHATDIISLKTPKTRHSPMVFAHKQLYSQKYTYSFAFI